MTRQLATRLAALVLAAGVGLATVPSPSAEAATLSARTATPNAEVATAGAKTAIPSAEAASPTTTPASPTTVEPIQNRLPAPPATLPLTTKQASTRLNPVLAKLSLAGFALFVVLVLLQVFLTRRGRQGRWTL